jgi:predicted DNA-binding protein (MmcQ/YjbR family)
MKLSDLSARAARLTAVCLALPEATRKQQGDHASFLVRGKTFAYYLANHHGDGIYSVCCKVLPGDNAALIQQDPRKFYMPAYIGPRGWVGLRLDLRDVDWEEAEDLVRGSYQLVAPKTLSRKLAAAGY